MLTEQHQNLLYKRNTKMFIDWLEKNDYVLHAYKAWNKEKYVWNTWKDYIIEERTHKHQDRLTLYTKWPDCYKIVDLLEKKWWILLSEWWKNIILQCQKLFEFDNIFEFYKYDLKKLEKEL